MQKHAAPPIDLARLESRIESRDGVSLKVRPIRPDDADRERQFITGLSEESRYNRLMYSLREPSASFIKQLVEIDFDRTMAFVAVDTRGPDERFVAVARYGTDEGGTGAEFAVVVADAWQGRGIGTKLARILFEYARTRGLDHVYGTILANNEKMIKLVRYLGMEVAPEPGDVTVLRATFPLRHEQH
jgi:acetyltransferase